MTEMKLIVVDLDGTLCDAAHRQHLAQAGEWDQFHSLLREDKPRMDVEFFLKALPMKEDVVVIGLTGRNERYRKATNDWMDKHEIYLDDILMRPDLIFEPDHELKPRMLQEYCDSKWGIQAQDSVLMILEDRDKVVEAWRGLGFRCWQVQPGSY